MKHNARNILAGLLVIALASLACNLTSPASGVVDKAATSVAGTVNALAGTAEGIVTALPHDLVTATAPAVTLPTLPPPAAESPLRVSFASPDGNLYTWAEGMASPQELVSSGDVHSSYVSPDGSKIAFKRIGSDYSFISLEVINADGTNRHTLLDAAGAAALPRPSGAVGSIIGQISWVPNSHVLAMNTQLLFEGPGLAFGQTLYLIDADSGGSKALLNAGTESWKFFYSPDGSKIAITTPVQIDIYKADGTLVKQQILSYAAVNTASEYAWVAVPDWSQDNHTLFAGIPPANPWDPSPGESMIQRFTDDGTANATLFHGVMPGVKAESVAFSPDFSKFLYFTSVPGSTDNSFVLHIGFTDGSPSVDYATGVFQYDPVWSPDNSRFFFTVGGGNTNNPYIGQVGVVPEAISDFTNASQIVWIDANRYIVDSDNGGVSKLLLGTIGAPTGLIFDGVSPSSNDLTFSVNR